MPAMQLELWRNLPVPPKPPRLSVWWPVPWSVAVLKLWGLPEPLLRARQPALRFDGTKRAPRIPLDAAPINPTTLPYAVKPSKVIWMIQTAPPPKPACFDDMASWKEYLMYLHASGERITRRQDLGKNTRVGVRVVTTVFDRIDHCVDCDIGGDRQRRMQREKRCLVPLVGIEGVKA